MVFDTLIIAEELKENIDSPNWVIMDCRFDTDNTNLGKENYLKGHIPQAQYAHLDDDLSGEIIPHETSRHPLPSIERFANTLSKWGIDVNTQVVVYDDSGGNIADRLWWMLQWMGHEAVALLNGGLQEWERSGFSIETEIPVVKPKEFVPNIQKNLLVDADSVINLLKSPIYLLVDSRSPERYSGEEEPLDPIGGHIPGAANLLYSDNLQENGLFHSKEYLKNRFLALHGNIPIENVIFYCGSGVTATHNILALKHAGLGNAKLYAGSWSEWITDPERPIITK